MNRDELITENMKLVYYVIHRNFPSFGRDEDIFQEGCVGLVKAANSFDETKGEFRNYAYTSILNSIRGYFSRNKQEVNVLSLDYMVDLNDNESVALMEIIPDDSSDKWYDKVERDVFLESLDERERKVVDLLKEGKTYREIGKELGFSRQTVAQTMAKVKSKWRLSSEEDYD